jgi:tRNA-dihydrouridine synthase A
LLTRRALLYTEMVTTGALMHGDVARHLRLDPDEHPVALQLGGCEPVELAVCAALGESWGYQEINLNCGCPSSRVQKGAFGVCLMRQPRLVADCVNAMRERVTVPVTVKHRIGIDRDEDYGFVRDFVGTVSQAGCSTFIVHARNAWLAGLSPKQNRDVPPLRPEVAHRLKADFPALHIVINGGLTSTLQVRQQLAALDGVMVGRQAYHDPWWLSQWDSDFFGAPAAVTSREAVEGQMVDYMERQANTDATPWYGIARHMLGLRSGLPGARKWRQVWSDHRLKNLSAREVFELARTGAGEADPD